MSSISALLRELAIKREHLRRLLSCQEKLNQSSYDFGANEYLCLEPQLTATSWAGSLATDFDQLRVAGILTNYQDIKTSQLNDVFRVLNDKIQDVKREIQMLEQRIAALRRSRNN